MQYFIPGFASGRTKGRIETLFRKKLLASKCPLRIKQNELDIIPNLPKKSNFPRLLRRAIWILYILLIIIVYRPTFDKKINETGSD